MISSAFIISMIVYFIKATTWKGMIFEKVGLWIEDKLGEYWSKPVIGCPVCMTPWWGTLLYTIAHYGHLEEFADFRFLHVTFVLWVAAGINTVILMINKEYDVAKKEDKLLAKELKEKKIE